MRSSVRNHPKGRIFIEGKKKMKKSDEYGEGVPMNKNPSKEIPCKGPSQFRTDYKETMEPSRGPRTYSSVQIIEGK